MTLYETLGINEQATAEEIKAAYRKKAKEEHPDVSTAPDAPERFGAIQKAYDVLSDPKSRDRYDATGQSDKPTIDQAESSAREMFASMIMRAVDQDSDVFRNDFLFFCRSSVAQDRANCHRAMNETRTKLAHAKKFSTRLKHKGGNRPDVAADMLNQMQKAMQSAIERLEDRLAVLQKVDEIINDYEFERDPPPQPWSNSTGSSSSLNPPGGAGNKWFLYGQI